MVQIDINLQLKLQELEKLEVVKELMTRSNGLTDNMTSILTSFETRLGKLEETINPVYQETGNLQRRHESILVKDQWMVKVYITFSKSW